MKKIEKIKEEGNKIYEAGDSLGAIEKYTQALKINSNYWKALWNRGAAFHDIGRLEEAMKDIKLAIKNIPSEMTEKLAEAYFELHLIEGHQIYDKGDSLGAIEKYTQALKINSNCWKTFWNRATAFYNLGRYKDAVKDMKMAIKNISSEMTEKLAEAYLQLFFMKEAERDFFGAAEAAEKVKELSPGTFEDAMQEHGEQVCCLLGSGELDKKITERLKKFVKMKNSTSSFDKKFFEKGGVSENFLELRGLDSKKLMECFTPEIGKKIRSLISNPAKL